MKRLLEKENENPQKDVRTREKIEKEVRNTIPTTQELQGFFVNSEIVDEIQK